MSAPVILYGVGATKAGTSWLYSYLHDHEDCHVSAVKELHYWDSFDPIERDKQLVSLERRHQHLSALREQATRDKLGWQVRTTTRQIDAIEALHKVLGGDRQGDRLYRDLLLDGATDQTRLVADITPAYALLTRERMRQMIAFSPMTRVIYLMRDPLARLWSHVRMHAERNNRRNRPLEQKANNVLYRILNQGAEDHITDRGDYKTVLKTLRDTVPAARLMVGFAEQLFTQEGLDKVCAFLGIRRCPGDFDRKVMQSPPGQIKDELVAPALELLRPQYDFVAREFGPLPDAWQHSLARAA